MIGNWEQYIFSLFICSLGCSIAAQMAEDSKKKALLRFVCGVVLVITLFRPLTDLELDDLPVLPSGNWEIADDYIAEGEKTARDEMEKHIKASCETYILDKAKKLGTEITVQVSLDENQVPAYILIQGEVEPEVQKKLQETLVTDLGIPKENQQWTQNQGNNSLHAS